MSYILMHKHTRAYSKSKQQQENVEDAVYLFNACLLQFEPMNI